MKTELKNKWIEALRSGEYEQGTGTLRDNLNESPVYCCLGVLCEISGSGEFTGLEFSYKLTPEQMTQYDYEEDTSYAEGELTGPMLDHFGLTSFQQSSLIQMNDNDLLNFNEIADWIERNL